MAKKDEIQELEKQVPDIEVVKKQPVKGTEKLNIAYVIGKGKPLKEGKRYKVSISVANELVNKGFATLDEVVKKTFNKE